MLTYADADVCWRTLTYAGTLVMGWFGQEIKLALPDGLAAPKKESFLATLFGTRRPRTTARGGVDPSTLCGEPISSEEDVLHVKELPTFDGKRSHTSPHLLL